jgi:hypothetical protein
MAQKNRYLRHARISEAKFRQSLRFFCADLTASQATDLSGLDRKRPPCACSPSSVPAWPRSLPVTAPSPARWKSMKASSAPPASAANVAGVPDARHLSSASSSAAAGCIPRSLETVPKQRCTPSSRARWTPWLASIPMAGKATTVSSKPASPSITGSGIRTTSSLRTGSTSTALKASGASPSAAWRSSTASRLPAFPLPQGV